VTVRLLESFGGVVDHEESLVRVRYPEITGTEAPYRLVKALRASFWVLGPLLARKGSAQVALPGGDAIGSRPVDIHLRGLVRMGADIRLKHGVVYATAPSGLTPQQLTLDFPSVGATHNLMMAASLVPGETVLHGAACEPEVAELAAVLSGKGAEIEGAGSSTIRIRGRSELGGVVHEIHGDRIEAATFLIGGAMTGGEVKVNGISADKLEAVLDVLGESGCRFTSDENSITVTGPERMKAVSFATAPFPGLATDVQPLLLAAMTRAEGECVVEETVFDNRFGHVAEYRRLGANIHLSGRTAHIHGVTTLSGAPVEATDIRAGAGLALMGLVAEGTTEVHELLHIDRGYERFVEKLQKLGARVVRIPVLDEKEVAVGC
jgi:UDP-N-acetylglucosamine 1-carboxyvinyltransferase